jgi:spore coat polysaccharide biosynthesis protein SpsF
MTSTRLPGKVLVDLAGAPMLVREIERLRTAQNIDEIAIATTTNATDDPVVALAERNGLAVHRGSEHDVLARYAGAAAQVGADIVVRITADCPLIDGPEVDRVLAALAESGADYASNVAVRTFPRGLDCEAFTRAALERCASEATSTPAREHVTYFIHTERPDAFRRVSVTSLSGANDSDLRWTVDTPEDLAMVRAIWEGLDLARQSRSYPEILEWVRAHPEVSALNSSIVQKAH